MIKYKVIYHWSDGTEDEEDEYYSSEEEAEEAAAYGLSCCQLGGELLEMSNPGDYPYDPADYENDSYEIVEIEVDD